ncbi:ubiquitin-binding protein cue5 [Arthrobotrys megalospora]
MSGTADKDAPPVVPPKERSPSPDDGLLREEPLDDPKPLKSTDVPTATAPSAASQTVTAPPAPTVESVPEGEETPPPKPPRPVSKFEQNVATLAEAFPDIDVSVIKAVLTASGGRVEPAFNALLGMSDPSAAVEIEEPPPPQPPRPRQQQPQYQQQPRDFRSSEHYNPANVYNDQPQPKTSTPASQMEADELYARQLAEHYGGLPRENRQGRGGYGNYPENRQRQQQQQPQEDEDRERSFFDDDLPVIRENLRKGFLDTQTKFNKFLTDFSKKVTGEEDETQQQQQQQGGAGRGQGQGQPQGQRTQQYPQRYSSRRSGDAYDADPEVIQGDFSHLELRDNTGDEPRRRPLANPNLFGSNPTNQSTGAPRKSVGFADQSEEDLYRKPSTNNGSGNTQNPSGAAGTTTGPAPTTGSKWAPLATVEPTPLTNDPFQLADSDDEHDNIQTTSAKTGPQESGTKNTTK